MGKKVIVCQLGSRHRYLIPKVINDSGMLYRLYTDSTAYSFIGKVALLLDKICKVPQSVKRLTKRIPAIPKSRLFSTDLFFFRETFLKCKTKDKFAHIASYYNGIGKECIKWGLGDCDCIYNMYMLKQTGKRLLSIYMRYQQLTVISLRRLIITRNMLA